MKSYLQPVLFVTGLLLVQNALADEMEKKFTVGIGTYALNIAYDNAPAGSDDELSGFGLSASYAFADVFGIRGELYSLNHDDFSNIDDSGIDIVAYIGTNLAKQGFKAYIGGGLFNETWKFGPTEEDFNGLQLSGGIGYNWDVVALDFVLGIRDPSDYEDLLQSIGISTDAAAASGSLILSGRF
jgi:hypothetical protein